MRLAGLPPAVLAGEAFGGEGKVQTAFTSGLAAAEALATIST
jgi:predicted NAD/FAD-dependent oxidoreductase